MAVKLSIVIATYNRGPALRRTLDSLAQMSVPSDEWELVVVNNNSTDTTSDVFAQFALSHPHITAKITDEKRQGLSYARNRGIKFSQSPYIALIDDDVEVNEGFASAYIDFFDRHPSAAAAGGKVTPLYETGKPEWISTYTERPIAGTLDMGGKIKVFRRGYPTGANMAFRRSELLKIGEFDTSLGRTGTAPMGGEEKDMFARFSAAGYDTYYVPDARVLHIIPESKLSPAYFSRVAEMCGRSERVRTLSRSRSAYAAALAGEAVKWCASLVLSAVHLIAGHPSRAKALITMRYGVSRGLTGK